MSESKKPSWFDSSWAKSVPWTISVITVSILLTRWVNEPRTEVTATYREAPFLVPQKLKRPGALDSAQVTSTSLSRNLYGALSARLSPAERRALPDSLQPPLMSMELLMGQPIESFTRNYGILGIVHIKNEGDKTLSPIQLLHESSAYYEYKDSNGQLQQGESGGKLALGELAPTESRDVYLWTGPTYGIGKQGPTIIYPDGKVSAALPVEVDGILGWLVKHSAASAPVLIMVAIYAILNTIASIIARAQKTTTTTETVTEKE
jgi:hypothetical protein